MSAKNKLNIEQFEKLRADGAVVLDIRTADEFALALVPGSYNIELGDEFQEIAGSFVFQDQLLVLVCPESSVDTSLKILEEMGYINIAGYLDGGIKTWIESNNKVDVVINIDDEELELEMKYGQLHLCDIRPAADFRKKHLGKAENIAPGLLIENHDLLDKDFHFCIYCEDGRLSMSLISYLKTHGIQNIYHLKGGFRNVSNRPGIELETSK